MPRVMTQEEYDILEDAYLTTNYKEIWAGYQEHLANSWRYEAGTEGVDDGFHEFLREYIEEELGKITIN